MEYKVLQKSVLILRDMYLFHISDHTQNVKIQIETLFQFRVPPGTKYQASASWLDMYYNFY